MSRLHGNSDEMFNRSSHQSTYSEPFGIGSEQKENDKSLLSKQFLSNPLVLMTVLNLVRLALIWFQGKIDEMRQKGQQASPDPQEEASLRQKLDVIASKI
jgi:hypothetical protein